MVCASLSSLRREQTCLKNLNYCTSLFALHKSAAMGERAAYETRQVEMILILRFFIFIASICFIRARLAIDFPDSYLSLVSDGMAQHHNQLPYMANQATFSKQLAQHLQGVVCHGRCMFIFRTFHNVKNGANVQIHSFLYTLQHLKQKEGIL